MLLGSLIALLLGLALKFALDYFRSDYRVTWIEYAVCAAAIVLLVAPLTSWIGYKVAFANQVTYHESWGGYELKADWTKTTCTRDGSCEHTYDCDPYQVKVVDQAAYTDDKGNYHPEVSHWETRYHDCPYTTEEWNFSVETTLGTYTIAGANLPTNPSQHRWEPQRGESLDGSLPSGIPPFWQAAKDRIDAGNPGPVTARRDYANYILASQSTILHKYSDAIDQYKKAGVLPPIAKSVHDFYYEDRVYFVGTHPQGDWQWYINKFDAALGTSLQGDLHLVIVDANKVNNPDEYTAALLAYWQSPAFGKDDLSKNGIVVVVGTTDGSTVAWARAGTGMPVGNEAMVVDIQNSLTGVSLTPEALIGAPTGVVHDVNGKAKFTIDHSNGALDKIVLSGDHAFQRVCMTCDSKGDHGVGYNYLKSQIQPSGTQKFWIVFIIELFAALIWGAAVYLGVPLHRNVIAPRYPWRDSSPFKNKGEWR